MTRPDTFPRIAKIGDREFEFEARFPPHSLNAMELFERERLDYPCTVQVRSHEDDMFSVFRIDDGPDSTIRVSCLFVPDDNPFGVDEEEQQRLYQAAVKQDAPSPGIYAKHAIEENFAHAPFETLVGNDGEPYCYYSVLRCWPDVDAVFLRAVWVHDQSTTIHRASFDGKPRYDGEGYDGEILQGHWAGLSAHRKLAMSKPVMRAFGSGPDHPAEHPFLMG